MSRFILPFLLLMACGPSKISDQQDSQIAAKPSALVHALENLFYAEDFNKIPSETFNAVDFGAIGDDKTLNTIAIQRAIDAANAAGGGRVIFDSGTYISGALFLKSNVELHLEKDVVIKAIQDDSQFPDRWTRVAGVEMHWPAALINIYDQNNVRISGEGTIDGNGKYWWDKFWGDPPRSGGMWVDYEKRDIRWAVDYDCKRVRAVVVYNSSEVGLHDVTILRSGFWTVSLTYANKVHVNGLKIRNNIDGFGPSSDGINTDSSKEILVENCDIDCNDDNLCIKSGRDSDGLRLNRVAENIVYRNCITRAGHGLFTIGSETSGGMRNIEVYGLKAIGTNTGIRFKSAKVRGGIIENIWFHDIEMENVKSPFHFELNWYPEYSYPTIPQSEMTQAIPVHWKIMTTKVVPEEKGIPEFKNLHFSNIDVRGADRGIYANAYEEKPMRDLHWENVYIEAQKAGIVRHARQWSMADVTLRTKDNIPLEVINGIDIELPIQEQIDTEALIKSNSNANPKPKSTDPAVKNAMYLESPNQQILQLGDTIEYFEQLHLKLQNMQIDTLSYQEPLGDGFYYSPLMITKSQNLINITAERKHDWIISIRKETEPKNIIGVDKWTFDPSSQTLVLHKFGAAFKVEIHD